MMLQMEQFFNILGRVAEKANARVIKCKPDYTSQLLSYRDVFIFTDRSIREYWDDQEYIWVDRDINAGINLKRVGLGLFPTIKRCKGKPVVMKSTTDSTSKVILTAFKASEAHAERLCRQRVE